MDRLPVLLGEAASGPSPANISRQIGVWEAEIAAWRTRDLSEVDSSTSGPMEFT